MDEMNEMQLWRRGLGSFLPRLPALLNFKSRETLSQPEIDLLVSNGNEMSVREAMTQAIIEAARGFSQVSPNPLVGCVILDREGRFLSKGYHEKYGGDHAEINALRGLNYKDLLGAHLIVTLEPCAHQGKTPSCARHLAQLPLAKVTYGCVDPNPLVAGRGAQILREAGILVEEYSELKVELKEICEFFFWNFQVSRPFVSLKVASTLDGFLALKDGRSQWITSSESRLWSHELRGAHDAVLVGVGTLLKDNPSLNVRHPRFEKQNKVIVLDSRGRGYQDFEKLNIFKTHAAEDIIWVVNKGNKSQLSSHQGPCVEVESTRHLPEVLEQLWNLEIRSIFVEGGAEVNSCFLSQNQVQRLYLFQAPALLGGRQGRSWSEGLDIQSLESRLTIKNMKSAPSGEDQLVTGVF